MEGKSTAPLVLSSTPPRLGKCNSTGSSAVKPYYPLAVWSLILERNRIMWPSAWISGWTWCHKVTEDREATRQRSALRYKR
eukprot:687405-Amphidinium_carterae.1